MTPMARAGSRHDTWSGPCFGLAAVLAWAVYNIGVSVGRAEGFAIGDLTFLRYLGAVLALTLWVLLRGYGAFGGLTVRRLALLVFLAGPPFALLYNIGMPLTRLSHAVVISPGGAMLVSSALVAMAAGQTIPARRLLGMAFLLAGLILVATQMGDTRPSVAGTWRGDVSFLLTGALYGTLTFCLGRWALDAVAVTWSIAVVSLALFGGLYAFLPAGPPHPLDRWVMQLILQGVLGGGLAVVFFVLAIGRLDASRAGVLPALVPPVTVILAITLTGDAPTPDEWAGLAAAVVGMVLALPEPRVGA